MQVRVPTTYSLHFPSLFKGRERRKSQEDLFCLMLRPAHSIHYLSSVQFISVAQSCPTLCNPMNRSTPGLPVHHLTPGVHLNPCPLSWWCCPTISFPSPTRLLLPSIFLSIRVFSNESALCIRWPKYCSFSLNISPSNEHSGLISFRMNWLDLLAIQETLKSLLQHHSSKASVLWCSAFFIVQLSHPYMTTGTSIALIYGPLPVK